MDSTAMNNSFVIQSLLQKADELSNITFGSNSQVTVVGEEQYSTSFGINISTANNSTGLGGLKIEEIDAATVDHVAQALSPPKAHPSYQVIEEIIGSDAVLDLPTSALTSTSNYSGEFFQDPNGPQVIRRPPIQGPVTYRQNVSVRFLQPPPVPPPGPLIIKEVRAPQLPAPPPLIIRQCAPPRPTPPPLVLRERPPQAPPSIPTQTVIKRLPALPVPPRSIVVERYPPLPPRPRDVIIERWIPYSKEPQRRKVITHRAPPPHPYPKPRNTIIVHEPVQANVIRSVQRIGIQTRNPEEYTCQYGHTLLDSATLVAQAQQAGVTDNLSPPLSYYNQQSHIHTTNEYYLGNTQTLWEPEYQYTTSSWEIPTANTNSQSEVYWTDLQDDLPTILRRLGLSTN